MRVCEYTIEGNADGPTLLFVHGWPDDASLWRKQVAALRRDYRCVLVTLPNFGAELVKAGGFDFPEVVELLAATIERAHPDGKVGLVTHDWGAYLGYMLEKAHPELIERMIALDVGGHLGRPGLKAVLMIVAYQWSLLASWIVGGFVPRLGNLMSRVVGRVVRVPRHRQASIRSRCAYLYFYFWCGMVMPWKRDSILGRYRPSCPVLFMFGERKPLMFHSSRWLEIVVESGGQIEGLPDAGHWFMETHPDVVNARMIDWLEENK